MEILISIGLIGILGMFLISYIYLRLKKSNKNVSYHSLPSYELPMPQEIEQKKFDRFQFMKEEKEE